MDLNQQGYIFSLWVSTSVVLLLLLPLLDARVSTGHGQAWMHIFLDEADLQSLQGDIISAEATIFSDGSESNRSSCLCEGETPTSGWCYLGQSVNNQRQAVNLTMVAPSRQTLLRCTRYVTVGRSYLYCNSRLERGGGNPATATTAAAAATTSCGDLHACSSGLAALVCSKDKRCVAWCDVSTNVTLYNETQPAGDAKAPVRIVHHLGHDVVGVIAGGAAVCVIILAFCVVDKVRSSRYCILHFPARQRKKKLVEAAEDNISVSAVAASSPPS